MRDPLKDPRPGDVVEAYALGEVLRVIDMSTPYIAYTEDGSLRSVRIDEWEELVVDGIVLHTAEEENHDRP